MKDGGRKQETPQSGRIEASPKLPSWAEAALGSGCRISSTYTSKGALEGDPIWTPHYTDGWDEELRSWQGDVSKAIFTCPECPEPHKPYSSTTGEVAYSGKSQQPRKKEIWICTKRCTTCEANIKRWRSGRSAADRVILVAREHPDAIRTVFITLTTTNYSKSLSDADAVRKFKKEVARWRRTAGVLEHFAGGIDFFEVTTNKTDGSKNAHVHGVYIQTAYWPQADILKSWGRGGARINARPASHSVRYCTGYSTKDSVDGVRCKESWGACRGQAYAALQESASGEDVQESSRGKASTMETSNAGHALESMVTGLARQLWRGWSELVQLCALAWATRSARSRSLRENSLWYEWWVNRREDADWRILALEHWRKRDSQTHQIPEKESE